MSEITELLERQEQWQRSRAGLSWSEKLRLAETLRDAALAMGCERKEAGTSAVYPREKGTPLRGRRQDKPL